MSTGVVDSLFPLAFGALVVLGVSAIVILARRGGRRKPVTMPGAPVGVATVISVQLGAPGRRGMVTATINVQVEPESGPGFPSKLTRQIPAVTAPAVSPGMRFPVMYRRDRPGKVKIARGEPEPRARRFFNHIRLRDGLIDDATLTADAQGLPAQATVVSAHRTGQLAGGLPVVDISLRILTRERGTFGMIKRMPLTAFEESRVNPGTMLPVKYLPGHPDAVVVSFTRGAIRPLATQQTAPASTTPTSTRRTTR